MQYKYFECECGNKFHAFVEFQTEGKTETYKAGVYKLTGKANYPTYKCGSCGNEVEACLNDPEAIGTKLLFNYMER